MKRSLVLAAGIALAATPALAAAKEADPLSGLFWLLVVLAVNFLPVLIAFARKHNSRTAILVVLLLLDVIFVPTATFGLLVLLTFPVIALAWFAILIWSFSGNTRGKDQERAIMIAQAMRHESESMRRQRLAIDV